MHLGRGSLVHTEPADVRISTFCHRDGIFIIRIQHAESIRGDNPGDQ